MTRLVQIVQASASLDFIEGLTRRFADAGFELHVVSPPGPQLEAFGRKFGAVTHEVPVSRAIDPLADVATVARMVPTLQRIRPDMVITHMTKASLVGQISARLAGVRTCVYHNHGMAVFGVPGWRGKLLWLAERAACGLADKVICISPSLRRAAVKAGICPAGRISTPVTGVVGMDTARFDPARFSAADRHAVRARYDIPADAPLVGFVGRILPDKGIAELAAAWDIVRTRRPDAHLLLVGDFDPRLPLAPEVKAALHRRDKGIRLAGFVADPVPVIAAFDVLALPSHHEGLPTVILESAAMGVPAVASRIHGIVDAVADGVTGTLTPVHDAPAAADALLAYIDNPELRRTHGRAARERILREFNPDFITDVLFREYMRVAPVPSAGRSIRDGCHGRLVRPWREINRSRTGGQAASGTQPPVNERPCVPSVVPNTTTLVAPAPVRGDRAPAPLSPAAPNRPVQQAVKRCIDFVGAAAGLLLALPLLAVVYLAVRLTMGGPVLFRAARAGRGGRPFSLWKFRTMSNEFGSDGRPLPDERRVTAVGRFLRKTSLDELPQLWNVLAGDMSLIGPRPLPVVYLPRYRPEHRVRHEVRPGITGWAQVNGRVSLTFSRRFEFDVWYVRNFSLLLDLRIVFRTVWQVLLRRDAPEVSDDPATIDDIGLIPDLANPTAMTPTGR